MGFYNAPDSSGETLINVIKDVFIRHNLPLQNVVGYSFDTAANMSGSCKGVQARLMQYCPHAMYVPCCNHTLDLVLQEAARQIRSVNDAIQFVKDVANVIRESSKRRGIYESLFGKYEVVRNLLSLCPTRWCVRALSMKRVIDNYEKVMDTLNIMNGDQTIRGDARARIAGFAKKGRESKTYVKIVLTYEIFKSCEETAKVLQGQCVTASAALQCINILRETLSNLRSEDRLLQLLDSATSHAINNLHLKLHKEARHTKTPRSIRHDEKTADDEKIPAWQCIRMEFFEALDLMLQELHVRFENQGLQRTATYEDILVKAAKGSLSEDEEQILMSMHFPETINKRRLSVQLSQLSIVIPVECKGNLPENALQMSHVMSSMNRITRLLFSEVEKLLTMILSLPTSVASAERTFSCLRRIKTWLRSTMGQSRLTHLAIMNVHSTRISELDMMELMHNFIMKTSERQATFGMIGTL